LVIVDFRKRYWSVAVSIFNRFFGKRESDDRPSDLIAEPGEGNVPTLQVLFAGGLKLDSAAVASAMRGYHPSMARADCEVVEELSQEGKIFGLAGWGNHVIKLVGFDLPMPKEVVEACVAPSHYAPELKEQARAHRSHLLLWYAGRDESVVEQFVALAAFVGVLERFGAIVVLNESALTSFPVEPLSGKQAEGDMMELLRTLPLPILYCGFVKYDVPDDTQVWMRTYGAHVMSVPDLAAYTSGHHEGEYYFDMFSNILRYMLNTGRLLAAGHTMQLGTDAYLRCRAPTADEAWLESNGEILVLEVVRADEINR
jgi:hypothetical protein